MNTLDSADISDENNAFHKRQFAQCSRHFCQSRLKTPCAYSKKQRMSISQAILYYSVFCFRFQWHPFRSVKKKQKRSETAWKQSETCKNASTALEEHSHEPAEKQNIYNMRNEAILLRISFLSLHHSFSFTIFEYYSITYRPYGHLYAA